MTIAAGDNDASMSDVSDHLERWRGAGVIDAETAHRIDEFEATRRTAAHAAGEAGFERPTVTEAFIYLGLVIIGIGVFALMASQWPDLESWARVAGIGVPAALALGGGFAMRAYGDPAVTRGGQLAWFLAAGLSAGLMLVLGEEYGPGVEEAGPRVVAGTAALSLAAVLWAVWPSHLQVLALGGATAFFAQMLGSWPDEFSRYLAGGTMAGIGLALICLAEPGKVGPRLSARFVSAALFVAGAFELQIDSPWYWEPWTLVAGALLVALSMRRETFLYMAMGMVGLFLGLSGMVGEHLSDTIGPQLAFIVVGVLIVAGTLILAQVRRAKHWGFA